MHQWFIMMTFIAFQRIFRYIDLPFDIKLKKKNCVTQIKDVFCEINVIDVDSIFKDSLVSPCS